MRDFDDKVSPIFVLEKLNESFTYDELAKAVEEIREQYQLSASKELLVNQMMWLAKSHYELDFSLDSAISERVIFRFPNRKNGIEDARFVKFTDDDGEIMYYATYTAYDGISIITKNVGNKGLLSI